MGANNQFPQRGNQKSKVGRLWYDGKVIMENKTFPILQAEKKRLLATGYYKKDKFKVSY